MEKKLTDDEILNIIAKEESELYREYMCDTPYPHWIHGKDFDAKDYYFWKDFEGKNKDKDWIRHSVVAYLNFIISRRCNILMKRNRENIKRRLG